jgi:hypothetical protein
MAQAALKGWGKPMRALWTLSGSTSANPLTEYDVYRANQSPDDWRIESWHQALGVLVARGLAVRVGHRGAYQWHITAAGSALLGDDA